MLPIEQITKAKAIIKTPRGNVVVKFFTDAPLASSNYITLAKDGFYDRPEVIEEVANKVIDAFSIKRQES